jgi:hypothetical protein
VGAEPARRPGEPPFPPRESVFEERGGGGGGGDRGNARDRFTNVVGLAVCCVLCVWVFVAPTEIRCEF